MFTALNKDGNKVAIEDAKKGEEYFCPICNGKLQIKDGQIKVKHFAHVSLQDCDDFSSDMSEWHRKWQKQFPLKNREVIIEHNGEKHRADVLACGYVIEFQHSPISCEEFNRRNNFYTRAGKKVVWIFDLTVEKENGQLRCVEEWRRRNARRVLDNGGKWEWKYHKKCFKDFVPHEQKNIILFFQIAETDFINEEDFCYIERVTWAARYRFLDETSFRYFRTSYYPGNKTELIEWIKNKKL